MSVLTKNCIFVRMLVGPEKICLIQRVFVVVFILLLG